MSDPAFAEIRGLLGHLVAERASIILSRAKRELLFFIQAESIKPGGLKLMAKELVEMFPERLGTPTMHKVGIKPGKKYSGETACEIRTELGTVDDLMWALGLGSRPKESSDQITVDECLKQCKAHASDLDVFLSNLCLDPRFRFPEPGKENAEWDEYEEKISRAKFPNSKHGKYYSADSMNVFKDIIGALYEYKDRKSESVQETFVETEITRQIFDCMEYAKETSGLVVISGHARIGKSTSAEAWCKMHPGQARYVSLTDASDEAGFFRPIARALGLPSSYTRKAAELRERISDMLQRSGLMLVLDEGHYLYPQHMRPTTMPRRLNWVLTALCNNHVPVVILCTPQFTEHQKRVEKSTGWTSEQFKGRISRFRQLPPALDAVDLEAIARFYLPGADKAMIKALVGYSMASETYVSAISNTVKEARYQATKEGRDHVTFDDIDRALKATVIPSTESMVRACEDVRERKPRQKHIPTTSIETRLNSGCKAGEVVVQRPVVSAQRNRIFSGELVEV